MVSVSLRMILLAMVLVVALVAATVSFVPLHQAALNIAEDSANEYKRAIAREVTAKVERFFEKMQDAASIMTSGARMGSWAAGDVASITKWMGYGVTLGGDSVNMIFDSGDAWTAGYVRPDSSDVAAGTFALVKYNTTHGVEYIVGTSNLSTLSTTVFGSNLDLRTRAFFPIIRDRQGWGEAFVGESLGVAEAVLPCGAPIALPNGTSVGAFYVRKRAAIIVDYFKAVRVKSTGRAMLLDTSTGAFVASNHEADPTTKVVNGTTMVTSYTDVQDPLIRSVVSSLGSTLLTCSPMPCVLEVGSGDDLVYVTVASVNDTYALNKRLVVMIPSSDFLGTMRDSTMVSLGAAAGAVVGLMALSALAVVMIVRPLCRLEEKLYASVTLEDDDESADSTPSMIQEIGNIEVAYGKLQAELKKVKSFLPQSVLKQLEEAEQQPLEDDPTEGSIRLSESDSLNFAESFNTSATSLGSSGLARSRITSPSAVAQSKSSPFEGGSGSTRIGSGHKLNTACSLVLRTCTVVMANVEGLHRFLNAPAELIGFHFAVMTIVANEVNAFKGVFDAFHGDRFTLTFNSSTSCASHCRNAAGFMMAVRAALAGTAASKQQHSAGAKAVAGASVLFGAATGKALCGNLGTEKIKRFCTVGPVVNHASVLLAACRGLQVDNVVSGDALKGMQLEYVCDGVSIATLPHCTEPTVIGTVRERRSVKMDEWMYELQQQEEATGDTYADTMGLLSKALDAAREGNGNAAQGTLAKVPVDVPASIAARVEHVRKLIADRQTGVPFPVIANC